jgi:hypothetical protein
MSNTTPASATRAARRRRRRVAAIGTAVAAVLGLTVFVVVSAVTSGGLAGTLTDGTSGISQLDPDQGLVGDEVHIVGAGFTGASDVKFNGVSVTSFNVTSDTDIVTIVPEGATRGPVSIMTPDGPITSDLDFSPLSPTILSFAPTSARSGDTVTITGNTGGLFKFINGAADAFGEPPVAQGGRYSLRKNWSPEWSSLSFSGSSNIGLGALGTVSAGLSFSMCLTTSCFGDVDASFDFDYKKAGKTWTFSEIPVGEDWGFEYSKTFSDSFYDSGKTGDNWGGFKGTVSGDVSVTIKLDSSPLSASLKLSFDLQAKAYLGAGGDWNYLGTYGVSYDSGSDRFCFGAKGYNICV